MSAAYKGALESRKSRLRSKPHATGSPLEKASGVVISSHSTVASSTRRHTTKPGSKVVASNNTQSVENKGVRLISC